jgi:hypothetical protein
MGEVMRVRGTQEILLSAVEVYFKEKLEQLDRKHSMDMFILAGEKADALKALGGGRFESCLGGVKAYDPDGSGSFFTHKSFLIDSSDLVLTEHWTSRKEWQDAPE